MLTAQKTKNSLRQALAAPERDWAACISPTTAHAGHREGCIQGLAVLPAVTVGIQGSRAECPHCLGVPKAAEVWSKDSTPCLLRVSISFWGCTAVCLDGTHGVREGEHLEHQAAFGLTLYWDYKPEQNPTDVSVKAVRPLCLAKAPTMPSPGGS